MKDLRFSRRIDWRKRSRVSSRVQGFFSTDVSKAKSAIVFRVNLFLQLFLQNILCSLVDTNGEREATTI
jgi:hypothetical protein